MFGVIKISLYLSIGCEGKFQIGVCIFPFVSDAHDDINGFFGWWRVKLHRDFSTIPLLMKLNMDLENISTIPHMIEEVFDFKAFMELYIGVKLTV